MSKNEDDSVMEIAFATRSKFLKVCENVISKNLVELDSGGVVHVGLEEGGYNGRVIVEILPNDRSFFETDWESKDPTRFPARIKAAATALKNSGCEGRYEISHLDGSLSIKSVQLYRPSWD